MSRFEAPRGTQDVTPGPSVAGLAASPRRRRGSLRALRLPPHPDPGLRGHRFSARTAGVGSDVVQKEMYTFSDRAERSRTLRPEGTAPICRAYLEHGMHWSAAGQALCRRLDALRYAAPQRAGTASTGSSRWRRSVLDPAVDAELIQLYAGSPARARRRGVPAAAELDRRPRVRPAYVERLEAWLDEHADEPRRRGARSGRPARCAAST